MLLIDDMDIRENEERRGKPAEDLVAIPLDLLDPNDLKKVTYIGVSLTSLLKEKLIKFLLDNKDVFAWIAADMLGTDTRLITHKMNVSLNRTPVKQRKEALP